MLARIENSWYSNNTYHSCPENNGKRWTKWKDVETSFYEKNKKRKKRFTSTDQVCSARWQHLLTHDVIVVVGAAYEASTHSVSTGAGETLWLTGVGDSFAWFLGRPTYLSADLCFTAILSSSFFSPAMHSELAERNSTKTGHMLESRCSLKACPKYGVSPSPTNRGPKSHLFRRLHNTTGTLTVCIFRTKRDIHNRTSTLTIRGLLYAVSQRNELRPTNGFKLEVSFHPPSVKSTFYFIARLRRRTPANGTQPNFPNGGQ